jgi:RNA polymerase sigma factor (sigma-70 family)
MADDEDSLDDLNKRLFEELLSLVALEETLLESGELIEDEEDRGELPQVWRQIKAVKERIIETNMGLVVSYAAKFFKQASSEQAEDYIAAGVVGLLQAIYTYDPEKGKFSSWAYKPIKREIQAAIRWDEFPEHSERQFTTRHAVLKAKRELEEMNPGAVLTEEQIAERADVGIEHAADILRKQASLSTNAEAIQEQLTKIPFPSPISDDYTELEIDRLWLEYLKEATAMVPIDELVVLLRHEGLDGWPGETFEEIGRWLGKGRETVRRLDAQARRRIEDNGYRVPKPLE